MISPSYGQVALFQSSRLHGALPEMHQSSGGATDRDHRMTINIIDEDGKSVDPAKMPIRADMPIKVPDEVPFLTRNLVLNFQGLKFPDEGIYHVDVTIDGRVVIRLPLRVVKVENPVPPGQSAEG